MSDEDVEPSPAPAPKKNRKRAEPGSYSRQSLIAKHEEREDKMLLLRLATEYAKGHKFGAKKTISTGLFPGVTHNVLHNALNNNVKLLDENARHKKSILTRAEQAALAQWVAACAFKKNPATDSDISRQVVVMLQARRADNRRRKHGRGCIPLTKAEARLADEAGAQVSHVWLTKFSVQVSASFSRLLRFHDSGK